MIFRSQRRAVLFAADPLLHLTRATPQQGPSSSFHFHSRMIMTLQYIISYSVSQSDDSFISVISSCWSIFRYSIFQTQRMGMGMAGLHRSCSPSFQSQPWRPCTRRRTQAGLAAEGSLAAGWMLLFFTQRLGTHRVIITILNLSYHIICIIVLYMSKRYYLDTLVANLFII